VKKPYWSREWLYNEHIVEGKSVNRIAREQEVDWSTIWYHLRKNGIPVRKSSSRKNFIGDREWLYDEHVVKGKSVNRIAEEQGVSWSVIRHRLRKFGIPLQGSDKWGKQYPNLEPSPELAYILGVIDGDGSVSGYDRIDLGTKDYEFAQEFRRALKAIGLKANVTETSYWHKNLKKHVHRWQCYANSAVFVRWYKGLTLKQREGIASQFPGEYLKGFFESEGSYYIGTSGGVNVCFSNFDYELLLIVQRLLTLLGYESRIYENKRKGYFSGREVTVYRLNLLGSSEEKHEFIKRIKPVIKYRPYDYSDPNGLRGREPEDPP